MSVQSPTVPAANVSSHIVRETIADSLQHDVDLATDETIASGESLTVTDEYRRNEFVVEENATVDVEPSGELIVRELTVDGTLNVDDDGDVTVMGGTPGGLTDPRAIRESDQAPFILTSYPNTGTAYPHLIVSEQDNSLQEISPQSDLHEGPFVAEVQIEARSSTERFNLKDGVREWILQQAKSQGTFQAAGFYDVSLEAVTPTDWDSNSQTTGLSMTISGTIMVTTE